MTPLLVYSGGARLPIQHPSHQEVAFMSDH